MATVETKSKMQPAYVPYGTFKNFIISLKEGVIPGRIDKSVMQGLSGGTQSHLTSTLKFFGLIGPNGEPLDDLETVVNACNTDEWNDVLAAVLHDKYQNIIGSISLKTATPAQLTECFRNNTSLEGTTVDKALRFYLQAIKEAKIEHSPHLAAMKVKSTYSKRPLRAATTGGTTATIDDDEEDDDEDAAEEKAAAKELAAGMIRFPIPIVGKAQGYIAVPKDIDTADCAIVKIMVQAVEAYAAQNTKK